VGGGGGAIEELVKDVADLIRVYKKEVSGYLGIAMVCIFRDGHSILGITMVCIIRDGHSIMARYSYKIKGSHIRVHIKHSLHTRWGTVPTQGVNPSMNPSVNPHVIRLDAACWVC